MTKFSKDKWENREETGTLLSNSRSSNSSQEDKNNMESLDSNIQIKINQDYSKSNGPRNSVEPKLYKMKMNEAEDGTNNYSKLINDELLKDNNSVPTLNQNYTFENKDTDKEISHSDISKDKIDKLNEKNSENIVNKEIDSDDVLRHFNNYQSQFNIKNQRKDSLKNHLPPSADGKDLQSQTTEQIHK